MAHLATGAHKRLDAALASSTARTYQATFRIFLAFLIFHNVQLRQVNVNILLAFLEFLHVNGKSYSMIQNCVSALKFKFITVGCSIEIFQDQKVSYFIKSLQRNAPLSVRMKSIVDIELLRKLTDACDRTYLGYVFKAAYFLGFDGFLRLSNICPHSIHGFQTLKHLTRGDIFLHSSGTKVLGKPICMTYSL